MNISVIIPVYNAEQFLESAVRSVLYHDEVKEVLLIEDGSPDNSLQLCKKLEKQHDRVKLYQHPDGKNKGAGASRNLGIKKASYDFIAFLDADDYWLPNRFDAEKKIFQENPGADGVYGAIGVKYVDEIGAKAWKKKGFNEQTLTTVSKPIKPEHLFDFLSGFDNADNYDGYYSIIAFTVKRSKLLESNITFDESLKLHQDTVFLWECAFKLHLFTGEHNHAIAKRSVHANNRYIHNKSNSKSRKLQFLSIRNCCVKNKVGDDYIAFFNQAYFRYLISSNRRHFKLLAYINCLLTDKVFRKYFSAEQLKHVIVKTIK